MAEREKEAAYGPSGLTRALIEQHHIALMRDRRVMEAVKAARNGERADVSFFIRSRSAPFFGDDRKPTVRGFAPEMVLEGDWDSPDILTVDAIAKKGASARGYVATSCVDLARIPNIDEFFFQLLAQFGPVQLAPQFTPNLARSVPYIYADHDTLLANNCATQIGGATTAYDGRGAMVCVIDMGCDFAHRNFRYPKANEPTGKLTGSRLHRLIEMNAGGGANVYPTGTIEGWIADPKPYDVSPYKPHHADNNCTDPTVGGAHGTLILDAAAGNGNGTAVRGVAPMADLCFVQVYVSNTGGRRWVGGDAILAAVRKAINVLDLDNPGSNRPTVFSVSLGTNDGPHESTDHGDVPPSSGEKAWNVRIDNLFSNAKNGRALVWSAGNQYRGNLHATGITKRSGGATSVATFDVRVPRGDQRSNTIKIWFDKPDGIDLLLQAGLADYKNATGAMPAPVSAPNDLADEGGRLAGRIEAATKYGSLAGSRLHYFSIRLDPRVALDRWETWRLEVKGQKIVGGVEQDFDPIRLDAWIERDDADQAAFREPPHNKVPTPNSTIEPLGTLSADAAGVGNAIVVGAIGTATYQVGGPIDAPGVGGTMPFSSAGPTRNGLQKPDMCAPGEIIMGAKSLGDPVPTGTGTGKAAITAMSGTSLAAPHVAGLIALAFDRIKRDGASAYPDSYPTSAGMRTLLIASLRSNMPGGVNPIQWDPQRGFGCIDAVNILK